MSTNDHNPGDADDSRVPIMSSGYLEYLRDQFCIPPGVSLRVPREDETPRRAREGEVCLFPVNLEVGLRLPFHPFIRAVLAHFKLAPSQLVPNAWRHIVGSVILWRLASNGEDHITLPEFAFCYYFRKMSKLDTAFWYVTPRNAHRERRTLVWECPTSAGRWWDHFFFAGGVDWEFGPSEGDIRAPSVPREWGAPDQDKMTEPFLNDLGLARVRRALDFRHRSCKDLITPENVKKYLVDEIPDFSSSPVLVRESGPNLPHKLVRCVGSEERVDAEDGPFGPPSTKKLCTLARNKLRAQADAPSPLNFVPPSRPRQLASSSSSESSVKNFDKTRADKRSTAPRLLEDGLILGRAKQLLSADDMKRMDELGYHNALQKGISHTAKGLAMMLYSGLESEKLSRELKILKERLSHKETSLKVREELIRAKDKELLAKEAQIRGLKEAASDAVKKFTKSAKYEDTMAECFLNGYEAFRSQASTLYPDIDWSSLEPGGS